jgi:hypothetical protein
VPLLAQSALSRFGLQFSSPIPLRSGSGPLFWAILAAIPATIILLYFLKLRRKPVQVPSTLLWKRSIEDLHVNSLFQRLRRNLLLFLQLLAVLLAIFALLGPQLKGSSRLGQRHILVVDNSASMSAIDVSPSRLDRAKAEAKKVIESMSSNDLAMIISFSDSARVVSPYSGNTRQLLQRLASIAPSPGGTAPVEALTVAAGLANPSRQFGEGDRVGEFAPPKLTLFTDGGFPDIEGFRLGNLVPEVVVVGTPPPAVDPAAAAKPDLKAEAPSDNLGILALRTARNEDKPDQIEAFGRVRNYRDEPVAARVLLYRHELDPAQGAEPRLIDAIELEIEPRESQSFKFDLPDTGAMGLEARLEIKDALAQDDRAYASIAPPRRARVLVVTPGNVYLERSLSTATAGDSADILTAPPSDLESGDLARQVATGQFDLVVYDGVSPKEAPPANTLYFGALPPDAAYANPREAEGPIILDWDIAHPLLQYIRDLSVVRVARAKIVDPPPGATTLIESNRGPLGLFVPREGFTDVIIGFSIFGPDRTLNTDWHTRYSFPMFLYHCLRLLGNIDGPGGDEINRPGRPVALRADPQTKIVEILPTSGGAGQKIERSSLGTFVDNRELAPGLYRVKWDDQFRSLFAVNLFDERESDLATRGLAPSGVSAADAERYEIKIGYTPVKGTQKTVPDRKEWWWAATLAALGIVLFEWYVYNRRVYI